MNPFRLLTALAIAAVTLLLMQEEGEAYTQSPEILDQSLHLPECQNGTKPSSPVPKWHKGSAETLDEEELRLETESREAPIASPIEPVALSTGERGEEGNEEGKGRGRAEGDAERTALRNQDGTRAHPADLVDLVGDHLGSPADLVGDHLGTANGANARVKNRNNEHGANPPRGVGEALRRLAAARGEDAVSVGEGVNLCPSMVEAVFNGDRHLSVRYIEMVASYLGARLEVRV